MQIFIYNPKDTKTKNELKDKVAIIHAEIILQKLKKSSYSKDKIHNLFLKIKQNIN